MGSVLSMTLMVRTTAILRYDEENDSVGSLEEFIVSDDGEESDYENDDEELCEDTESMSSGDELEKWG